MVAGTASSATGAAKEFGTVNDPGVGMAKEFFVESAVPEGKVVWC